MCASPCRDRHGLQPMRPCVPPCLCGIAATCYVQCRLARTRAVQYLSCVAVCTSLAAHVRRHRRQHVFAPCFIAQAPHDVIGAKSARQAACLTRLVPQPPTPGTTLRTTAAGCAASGDECFGPDQKCCKGLSCDANGICRAGARLQRRHDQQNSPSTHQMCRRTMPPSQRNVQITACRAQAARMHM